MAEKKTVAPKRELKYADYIGRKLLDIGNIKPGEIILYFEGNLALIIKGIKILKKEVKYVED